MENNDNVVIIGQDFLAELKRKLPLLKERFDFFVSVADGFVKSASNSKMLETLTRSSYIGIEGAEEKSKASMESFEENRDVFDASNRFKSVCESSNQTINI